EESRTEPTVLASRSLRRSLAPFSADNVRYVPTMEELIERTNQLTHAQVVELYRDFIGSQAGELIIVGDLHSNACLPIRQSGLADWKANKPYSRIVMKVPEGLKGAKQSINTPDKANAMFAAGMLVPMRDDDPDYAAMEIADYLFGSSSLSSRLGDRVRQKEGLSYGVSSNFNASAFDKRATFSMSAICNPANIDKVQTAIKEELDKLLADGVSQEELERAKQGHLQSQKVRRSSGAGLASMLAQLSCEGRTRKFVAELGRRNCEMR